MKRNTILFLVVSVGGAVLLHRLGLWSSQTLNSQWLWVALLAYCLALGAIIASQSDDPVGDKVAVLCVLAVLFIFRFVGRLKIPAVEWAYAALIGVGITQLMKRKSMN